MEQTITLLNAITAKLGGTTTHRYNIDALNEWCTLSGGTGGHVYDIDAYNEIDVLSGGSGGHKYTIDALNSIDVALGGSGGYKFGWVALASLGTLLNQIPEWFAENFTGVPVPYANNPLLPTFEGFYVREVIKVNGEYHHFGEKVYGSEIGDWQVVKTKSKNGLNLNKPINGLLPIGGVNEYDERGQADPSVIYDGPGDWKMWFDATNASKKWISNGYATSTDGENWTKVGACLSVGAPGEWDSANVHQPCVLKHNGTYYQFYCGSDGPIVKNIGLATSTDGFNFTKHPSNPVLSRGESGQWDALYIRPSRPLKIFDIWYMWYWGDNGSGVLSIGLATSPDLINWTKKGVKLTGVAGSYPSANSALLASGSNPIDKLIQFWYGTYSDVKANFATITIPSLLSRLSKFTTSALNYLGDNIAGVIPTTYTNNYMYFHKVSAISAISTDAIKLYLNSELLLPFQGMIRAAIYSGITNPTDLIAQTEEKDWVSMHNFDWNIFKFDTPISLIAGNYWIALWSNYSYKKQRQAGGSNNWGNIAITYTGEFPATTTAVTTNAFSDVDVYLIETRVNVHEVSLLSEPTKVYFNNIEGNKKTVITDVDSEFDWFWSAGILYIYSVEHPDVRYQITYE